MNRRPRYHPIETEAIIELVRSGTPWKDVGRRIGRHVDPTSIRQHVQRVAPDILVIHRQKSVTRLENVMLIDGRTTATRCRHG